MHFSITALIYHMLKKNLDSAHHTVLEGDSLEARSQMEKSHKEYLITLIIFVSLLCAHLSVAKMENVDLEHVPIETYAGPPKIMSAGVTTSSAVDFFQSFRVM